MYLGVFLFSVKGLLQYCVQGFLVHKGCKTADLIETLRKIKYLPTSFRSEISTFFKRLGMELF